MPRYIDLIDEQIPYDGPLPPDLYEWPMTFEQQNDPAFLDYAEEIHRLATALDCDFFEIVAEP